MVEFILVKPYVKIMRVFSDEWSIWGKINWQFLGILIIDLQLCEFFRVWMLVYIHRLTTNFFLSFLKTNHMHIVLFYSVCFQVEDEVDEVSNSEFRKLEEKLGDVWKTMNSKSDIVPKILTDLQFICVNFSLVCI